jgi:adenylosuccinate synthase
MHDIEVEYVTFPGWRGRSTSECRTFNSLPHNARLYVQFIEQFLGVPGLLLIPYFPFLLILNFFF